MLNLAARHKDGLWVMVYLGSKASFAVNMNRLAASASDDSHFVFAAPPTGPFRVEVRLIFRRAFKTLADQKGWNVPDILMGRYDLVLD